MSDNLPSDARALADRLDTYYVKYSADVFPETAALLRRLAFDLASARGRLHILQQDFEGQGNALTREVNRKLDAQEDVAEMLPVVEAAIRWANEVRLFGGNEAFTALKEAALAYEAANDGKAD